MINPMPPALIPPDDADRLRDLRAYDLLYTAAEEAFDNLTQIMAQVFGVPMVFMSLVDEHTVFYKSQVGNFGRDQVDRRDSLCSVSILKEQPTVYEDTWLEATLASNPLVKGKAGIRFYAGAPLTSRKGYRIGSVCVVDTAPRVFGDQQVHLLERFARLVMHEIEVRFAARELVEAREGQKKLLKLVESSADGMAILEFSGTHSFINPAGQQLVGFTSPQQVLDTPVRDLYRAPDYAFFQEQVRPTVLETGRWAGEMRLRHLLTGEVFPVYSQVVRIDDTETGLPLAFGAVLRDLRPEQAAHQALQQSEQQLWSLFEQAPVGIAILENDQLRFRLANPFYGLLVDRTPEQLVDKPLLEALPELEGQGFDELLHQVMTTGVAFTANEVPVQVVRNQALATIYVNLTYQPYRSAHSGPFTGVFVVATEVTPQVVARQALHAEQNRLSTILREVPVGILLANPQGELTYGNPQVEQIFRHPFRQSQDIDAYKNWLLFDPLTDEPFPLEAMPMVRTLRQRETVVGVEIKLQRGDGTWGYASVNTVPVYDEQGALLYGVAAFVDITELKQAEEARRQSEERYRQLSKELESRVQTRTAELVTANHDLKRSNDSLQEFAMVASHDLQEPLRKIQSFSTLLEERYRNELGAAGLDLLNRMNLAGGRMSNLIKDLLAYSRISTRQQVFGEVSLQAIVGGVLTGLDWQIQQRQAQIEVAELPSSGGTSPQLGQLFQNLLSNALKFTPPDQKPHIDLIYSYLDRMELPPEIQPTSGAGRFCQISIRDQGVGFDTKYLDRIFQVFQRLHGKNEFAGTGVGLAICQRVVENHGGGITASSQPGQGATFMVYLPG
jgi:PAS domain S-box-containing protein